MQPFHGIILSLLDLINMDSHKHKYVTAYCFE
jgi:hypothetical protein